MSEIRKQLRTYASSNIYFTLDPEQTPLLRKLLDQAEELDLRTEAGFNDLRPSFAELVRSREVHRIIDNEVNMLAHDTRYVPSGSSGTTMLLAESPTMVLTATILEERHAASHAIYSPAGNAMFGNLGPSDFPVCLHQRPANSNIAVFDKTKVLEIQPPVIIGVGEVLMLSATEHVPEYRCTGPSLMLKLTSRVYQPLIWVYDKFTGIPTMASAGNLHSSRTQMMLRTLAALEAGSPQGAPDPRSVESVATLCKHEFHFVRWGAVQTLCNIDFERGKQALMDAVDDPHPHIVNAARSSVSKLRQQGLIA